MEEFNIKKSVHIFKLIPYHKVKWDFTIVVFKISLSVPSQNQLIFKILFLLFNHAETLYGFLL